MSIDMIGKSPTEVIEVTGAIHRPGTAFKNAIAASSPGGWPVESTPSLPVAVAPSADGPVEASPLVEVVSSGPAVAVSVGSSIASSAAGQPASTGTRTSGRQRAG